jgi:hypothetical protein
MCVFLRLEDQKKGKGTRKREKDVGDRSRKLEVLSFEF